MAFCRPISPQPNAVGRRKKAGAEQAIDLMAQAQNSAGPRI
jgi:hypothetical protein